MIYRFQALKQIKMADTKQHDGLLLLDSRLFFHERCFAIIFTGPWQAWKTAVLYAFTVPHGVTFHTKRYVLLLSLLHMLGVCGDRAITRYHQPLLLLQNLVFVQLNNPWLCSRRLRCFKMFELYIHCSLGQRNGFLFNFYFLIMSVMYL